MTGASPREDSFLVTDTSVAVKWHLPEDDHDRALRLLEAAETGVTLLAPSTIQPEFFNALWQQHRRSGMPTERIRAIWDEFTEAPLTLFEIDPLAPLAVEIALSVGVIIYDALFLALAEEVQGVMVTADDRLLRALDGTSYARLARSLSTIDAVI